MKILNINIILLWLCISSLPAFAQDLSFGFANSQNTCVNGQNFYEADVTVASIAGIKLGQGTIYINYNPAAFGENIKSNGFLNITYPPGYILGQAASGFNLYSNISINDNTSSRVALSWLQVRSSGCFPANNVSSVPVLLAHIKLSYLAGGLAQPPTICLQNGSPFDDQIKTACGPVSSCDVENCSGANNGFVITNDIFNCAVPTSPVVLLTFYRDLDGDAYGNAAVTAQACSAPTGYVSNSTDCNDNVVSIHPGATEACNSLDDDCDTQVDEGVLLTFYRDLDGDAYGNAAVTAQACSAPTGYVSNSTDCNDNVVSIHPGATEACNSLDDDCDTQIDEGVLLTFYRDLDGDTYGNAAVTAQACSAPTGYVSNSTDCNDNVASIHPGATEVCNGLDDDCVNGPESATNTWTGNGDALNWSGAANWSNGIVPLSCQDIVIPAGKTVKVPASYNAFGKSLDVHINAQLTVEGNGTLSIQN